MKRVIVGVVFVAIAQGNGSDNMGEKEMELVRGLDVMESNTRAERIKFISFMKIFHPEYTDAQIEELWGH